LLKALHPRHVEVVLQRVDEAEVDEMWSFVGKKKRPRWLWHALDHRSGKVLAYVFGRRTDEAFVKLKTLLKPFGIRRYYSDSWGPTNGTSPPKSTAPASATRSKSSANISHCARASSG